MTLHTESKDSGTMTFSGVGHQWRSEEKVLKAAHIELNDAYTLLHELKHERFNDLKMKLLKLKADVRSAIEGAEEVYNRNS